MASRSPCRIVVMASGSGSNFQALLDGVASGRVKDAEIVRLFVNRKTAYAVTRAEKAAVPSEYFNMVAGGFQAKGEKDAARLREARTRYDAALAEKVLEHKPDLVVLAGWMHVFTEGFLVPVAERGVKVINLHPALPGELFANFPPVDLLISPLLTMMRPFARQIRRSRRHRSSIPGLPGRQTREQ